MTELERQEEPEARCPACGGEPKLNENVAHRLSNLGYAYDDVTFTCSDCGNAWTHGIPIGEGKMPKSPLMCQNEACDQDFCLVHRVRPEEEGAEIDVKCPECYYFNSFYRGVGEDGAAILIGYPQITGDQESVTERYGYSEDDLE